MQSATGQYGTQAGEPAQPVQHSVMTASSFGFFFRGVVIPSDFGSLLITVAVMTKLCHIQRLFRGAQSFSIAPNVSDNTAVGSGFSTLTTSMGPSPAGFQRANMRG